MIGVIDQDHGPRDGLRVHLCWASRKFAAVQDQLSAYHQLWSGPDGLAFLGNVRLSIGAPPRQYPASVVHVHVGADLSWYTDPGTGQVPAGVGPHWFGFYPGDPWLVRGCRVDDAPHRTVLDLVAGVVHELGHCAAGESWHDAERLPPARRAAAMRDGFERARVWANELVRTGRAGA